MNPPIADALRSAGKPLVTVIIPFLNEEEFLETAIDSVLAQTYEHWELLLVDDGSTDASTRIAKSYAQGSSGRISYLEHEGHCNRSQAASRNLGVRSAKGLYLAFLDADDLWLPNKLERQVAILDAHPEAGMVFGSSLYWHSWTGQQDDLGRDFTPTSGLQPNRLFEPPSLLNLLYPLGSGTPPPPSDLMVRRSAVEDVGGFEECFDGFRAMYEDQAFLAKLYLAYPVFASDELWDKYRLRTDSCVATATKAGRYRSVRNYFLNWLELYLRRLGFQDETIWTALRKAQQSNRDSGEGTTGEEWSLRAAGGNLAHLILPDSGDDALRVEIERMVSSANFDVQVNRARLGLAAGRPHLIEFQARADKPRRAAVGISLAREPWSSLGFYQELELNPEWRNFAAEFVPISDEPNGRLHFDIGCSDAAVEIRGISLLDVQNGRLVAVPASPGNETRSSLNPPDRHKTPLPRAGEVNFGDLRRGLPISETWGLDRGTPVDRYYIRKFIAGNATSIQGRVLEIGDNSYTREFGGKRVRQSDVLHVAEGDPNATIVADLASAPHIPSDSFDCVILTQTLQYIYEVPAALATLHRILKPGGVLLATFPGISPTHDAEWKENWYWTFTVPSARRLFGDVFSASNIKLMTFGNVLSAVSFLHGLAAEELTQEELDFQHAGFEVTIAVRAAKADRIR